MAEYKIDLHWDGEASVWYCTSKDIPGLILEADEVDVLEKRVAEAAPEMLELNGVKDDNFSLHFSYEQVELVAA